jgi:hypothetical protein
MEVNKLSIIAQDTNKIMLDEMENHSIRLNDVQIAVDDVKTAFERASEGAVKIGDRLSVSELERKRLDIALDLVNYINWYDAIDDATFKARVSSSSSSSGSSSSSSTLDIIDMNLMQLQKYAIPKKLQQRELADSSNSRSSATNVNINVKVDDNNQLGDWGKISQMLSYLRRVLFDLSGTDFAQNSIKNILKVSEVAEQALLSEFLNELDILMEYRLV